MCILLLKVRVTSALTGHTVNFVLTVHCTLTFKPRMTSTTKLNTKKSTSNRSGKLGPVDIGVESVESGIMYSIHSELPLPVMQCWWQIVGDISPRPGGESILIMSWHLWPACFVHLFKFILEENDILMARLPRGRTGLWFCFRKKESSYIFSVCAQVHPMLSTLSIFFSLSNTV